MYDLYDHITAEPFAPRPILITNFLCHLTNIERRTPSQYNGRYLCIPSVGFVELQAGLEATSPSKKRITTCHTQRGSSAICFAFFFLQSISRDSPLVDGYTSSSLSGTDGGKRSRGSYGGCASTQTSIMLRSNVSMYNSSGWTWAGFWPWDLMSGGGTTALCSSSIQVQRT
jgi:hypothetical protein